MDRRSRPRSHSLNRSDRYATASNARSRSPYRDNDRHYRTRNSKTHKDSQQPGVKGLPFNARQISKHDLRAYRPMFALYLDVQKRMDIEEISENEVKGRWKSFVGKWNRGELAEGWYDPKTLDKALSAHQQYEFTSQAGHDRCEHEAKITKDTTDGDDNDSEDDFGPAMPHPVQQNVQGNYISKPTIPTIQDLQARDEQQREDAIASRNEELAHIRSERKGDRRMQRERLDDIVPRAEAGSRERMLENKRIAAESNRAFASAAHTNGDIELRDADVMGDEDSVGDLKRLQKEQERKKNERELRREEILRARIAEREERVKGLREKETKTMDMLKKIAQARFGSVGNGNLDHG